MADKPDIRDSDATSTTNSDWPTLIERAVDDVSRIMRSEAQMFQTSIGAALELQISKILTRLMVLSLLISGAVCLLCAATFLLHQWLAWWQAFGTIGLATLVTAIALNVRLTRRAGSGT
jgi:hypothetical protein